MTDSTGGGYTGMPQMPATPTQGRPGRPAGLVRSILIWSGAILAWLLGNILGIVLHSSGVTEFTITTSVTQVTDSQSVTQSQATVEPGISVAIYVVLAVLWAVLVLLMWLGQNWARIVQTVFAGIGLISLFTAIFGAFRGTGLGDTVQGTLHLIALFLVIAGIVTIWRKPLNPYFRR
jgi:hypothetical protein